MSLRDSSIKTLKDFELEGKTVFLRLDLNVPMSEGKITDDTRIRAGLPTIRFAMEAGAKLVLCSHLGRPKGEYKKEFSLEPVAERLGELLNADVVLVEDPLSDAVKGLLPGLKKNQILLLENIRFYPGETKNAPELAQVVSEYIDIYINDAFGASHRAHSSIVSVAQTTEMKGMGFLIEKEVKMLSTLISQPKAPYVAILGGAKVSDKIDIIERLVDLVDVFIVGGAMAYTFLKAMDVPVGQSRVEEDKVGFAKDLIQRIEARDKKILLPMDHVVVDSFSHPSVIKTAKTIESDFLGVDIGENTIKYFSEAIGRAGTVFWNGPMGVFEDPRFSKGSFAIADAVAQCSGTTVVGGGDSAAAANASGHAEKMTHISTGGGASLEFLQGASLPGLEVLRPPKRSEVL